MKNNKIPFHLPAFYILLPLLLSILFQTLPRAAAADVPEDTLLKTYIIRVHPSLNVSPQLFFKSFLLTASAENSNLPRLLYSYKNTISGFAARLTDGEIKAISSLKGFVSAHPDHLFHTQITHSPEFLGLVPDGSRSGGWSGLGGGDGVVIGVIDTGVFPDHPSFSGAGMPPPPSKWKGRCDFSAAQCNNKLIGARTFLSGEAAERGVAPQSVVPPSPIDEIGHGTHTASTAAGAMVADAQILGNAKGAAVGMAPRAHLAIYKVRKKLVPINTTSGDQIEAQQLKRVSAKELMSSGEVIFLPMTVQNSMKRNNEKPNNHDEIQFIRGLILYKDPAIIVINKPHGLPVQGGYGIKNSIDLLAATSLKFDYPESPRLVHRLDRDCSGLLVLGRTQVSTSILHSIFREKTCRVLRDSFKNVPRVLQRKYWAIVIGTPKKSAGLLSAPVGKVALKDGKSERITVITEEKPTTSHRAVTEYKVIKTSNGYTWLELCPLTGRKHQLRVHCAEVLRTPIVGDYKYGGHAHRKWAPMATDNSVNLPKEELPFGLEFEGGSISEKQPRLHLHCRQMVLPNIAGAVERLESASNCDLAGLDELDLVASLPPYMQLSWDVLGF